MPGCLGLFFRVLAEAITARIVSQIVSKLLDGTVLRWLRNVLNFILGRFARR